MVVKFDFMANLNIEKYLNLAADVALIKDDERTFYLGAVGLRSDGVVVAASNVPAAWPVPTHHAEARLCRKLDRWTTVFVARVNSTGWAMARPCASCQARLRRKKVLKVFYTIGPSEYGVMNLNE
jgi:hypothetical protein